MTCIFEPFGGGSRVVSLWDMLRFHADKFVEVFNLLNTVESLLETPQTLLADQDTLSFIGGQLDSLQEQLLGLNLRLSAKTANKLHFSLTKASRDNPDAWARFVKRISEELRERIADELEGKAIYYVSDHVDLLSDAPLFGDGVDEAFPSARYDISEAGCCLALRRPTACVLHLTRALEPSLASLAAALGVSMPRKSWEVILNKLQNEIAARSSSPPHEQWKDKDEPFFSEAASHFRIIKNAWRNHAVHGRDKYTEQEAEDVYRSVRSFMQHLSERLSEGGRFS